MNVSELEWAHDQVTCMVNMLTIHVCTMRFSSGELIALYIDLFMNDVHVGISISRIGVERGNDTIVKVSGVVKPPRCWVKPSYLFLLFVKAS